MKNGPVTKYNAQGQVVYGRPLDEPKQYTQGWTEFYKLKFKVTPDVLIPRPETELLVDEVLNWAKENEQQIKYPLNDYKKQLNDKKNFRIIDVGTGSGNIAISIAKNLKNSFVMGLDISKEALAIASDNVGKNKVKNVFLQESDLLSLLSPLQENGANRPDVIVANLPYIPKGRIDMLDPSVRDFEPYTALNGGFDGFELYRRLFDQMIFKNLIPQLFIGEIDDSHQELAAKEARKYFKDAKKIEVKLDLAKKPRFLVIHF